MTSVEDPPFFPQIRKIGILSVPMDFLRGVNENVHLEEFVAVLQNFFDDTDCPFDQPKNKVRLQHDDQIGVGAALMLGILDSFTSS